MKLEIPENWSKATIPDLIGYEGVFADGDWIESKDQDPNGEIRLIQLADIGDGTFKDKSNRFLTKNRADELNCTYLRQNDILIARLPDPLGRACLFPFNEQRFVTAVDVAIVRMNLGFVSQKWLMYIINSQPFREEILARSSGSTRVRISRKNLGEIFFPLPPLPEQRRIVAKLDAAMERLRAAEAALEEVPALLEDFRRSVLHWAVTGRLTSSDFSTWEKRQMDEVCTKIQDGSHFSPQVKFTEPGKGRYMYLTSKNIRNNYLDLSKVEYVDEAFHQSIYPRCNPEFGDVLLTKDGANTGNVTLNTLQEPFSLLSSVCLLKADAKKLDSNFLKYYTQSPDGQENLLGEMTGSAITRIVLKKIKTLEISLPPLDEQKSIVEAIEKHFVKMGNIEKFLDDSKQELHTLRQTLLTRAFRGELLTAAELAEVQAAADYEPAGVLLERIKEEKARMESWRKRGKGNSRKSAQTE